MQIIVAEDDLLLGKTITSLLTMYGHQVRYAPSGDEALRMFKERKSKILFSDWVMPGYDGLELCRHIRAASGSDYCYFIMLTANTAKGNYQKAMDAGVDDFLTKPVDKDALIARLRVAERIMNYMGHIRRLESLLPICSYCKKIRNESEGWQEFETYLHKHAGAEFSHGVCPDCMAKHFVGGND